MKKKHWLILVATLSTGFLAQPLVAQEQPAPAAEVPAPPAVVEQPPAAKKTQTPKKKTAAAKKVNDRKSAAAAEPATTASVLKPGLALVKENVKEKSVNVRGQAAINSEVVTRLSKGTPVVVLEEITLKKPGVDEPALWAKIALPTNAFVWVNALFVDSDSKTVKGTKLNLRSGPGENYSILGRIPKGTAIKEVETKGDWIKIEPPADAYAFVAAHLLTNTPAADIAAVAPTPAPPPPAEPPPTTPPPPPTTVAPPEVVAPPQPVTVPGEVKPADTNAPPTAPPSEPAPPAPVAGTKPDAAPPTAPPAGDEPLIKRIVSREGLVRNTVSIQAPSYFKLENLDNRKTVNYIYSPSTNIILRDFYGKRIIVTGEEILDERWPNTPVINIESIKTVE